MRYAQIDLSINRSHKIISIREFPEEAERIPADLVAIPDWVSEDHYYEPASGEFIVVAPEPPTPGQARDQKLGHINRACDAELDGLTNKYGLNERLTWDTQERQARAYAAGDFSAAPLVEKLAIERGVGTSDLANRIIAKADAYTNALALALGKRKRLEQRLDAIVSDSALSDEEKRTAIEAVSW